MSTKPSTTRVDSELEQFVSAHAKLRGPQCWTCKLPAATRDRIEKARLADPIRCTFPVLAEFLQVKLGIKDATDTRLRDHFRRHVQVAK